MPPAPTNTADHQGDASIIIDGQPVALHGSLLSCGCQVLSAKQISVFVEPRPAEGRQGNSLPANVARMPKSTDAAERANTNPAESYDEALRFTTPDGTPLVGIPYALMLASGQRVTGATDNEGKTKRVRTDSAEPIIKAELKPKASVASCCRSGGPSVDEMAVFDLEGILTNSANLGVSVVDVKTTGHERSLTAGEIEMARMVFKDVIDYAKVKIHNHGYWMTFGFQPKDTAMAPNGEIYLPGELFREDFSTENMNRQHLFIHEMTHVWQHQLGYPIKLVRVPRPRMSYTYTLTETSTLGDFNMEAQGNVLADWFLTEYRGAQGFIAERKYVSDSSFRFKMSRTLRQFISNPSARTNLPNTTR